MPQGCKCTVTSFANTIYVANSDDNTVCHISSGTAEIHGTAFTISKEVANRNN